MNYIDKRALKIYTEASGDITKPDPLEFDLYRIYAVLSFAKGTETTLEDVHDAWSSWRSRTFPEHRSIVPFEELTPEVQELDRKYCEAIHKCSEK